MTGRVQYLYVPIYELVTNQFLNYADSGVAVATSRAS